MSGSDNVLKMELSEPVAKKILKGLVTDPNGRIFVNSHANIQMNDRKITMPQVRRCLASGCITEGPYRSVKGNWEFVSEVTSAGDIIRVVAALDHDSKGNYVVVITAIKLGSI